MQKIGARSLRGQERLREVRRGNRRMFVFLAILAVIGGWNGHVRIEQRIEARALAAAKAEPIVKAQLDVEISAPTDTRPATINAIKQATRL